MLKKGTKCCTAATKAIDAYTNAKLKGVYDGKNSDVNANSDSQLGAAEKSQALTALVDSIAALGDCDLNMKDNRAEVSTGAA